MKFKSISYHFEDRGKPRVSLTVLDQHATGRTIERQVELTRADLNDILATIIAAHGLQVRRRPS